jgi:pyruvate formate lyase activating enzyme
MVLIKGLNKTCLIDFEPYTACVVFLGGCNFRCGYCHNPDLVLHFNNIPSISEDEFFSFLDKRKKWLDGAVVTGGEPTMQKDLVGFFAKIKEKGFLVKLDTNGSNPHVISALISKKLVDYIAMDIKTSLGDYNNVCGVDVDIKKIRESIELIKNSSVDYEFRTTFIPGIVTKDNALNIAETLKGARKYVIQNFREKADMIEARFKNIKPYSKEELEDIKKAVSGYFEEVKIR